MGRRMDTKRLSVAIEGDFFDKDATGRKRWLQRGALMENPGRWTIVTWVGNTDNGLGTARKIERVLETGEVTMLISVQKHHHIDLDDVECSVNFIPQMVTASKDGKIIYVIAAYITEVMLELKGPGDVAIPETYNPQTPTCL